MAASWLLGRSSSSRFSSAEISSLSRFSTTEPRIYGPIDLGLGDDELVADRKIDRDAIRSALLAKIRRCYGQVKHKGVIDAGFCFGLLDPVSNIVAGIVIALAVKVVPRDKVSFRRLREPDLIGDMNQRSLKGLVAFLVALFPSLTNTKAMWYLNKAELDLLVAACLIIKHRGMERSFGFASDTTVAAVETAFRCAAAAAQHPNPQQFALGWKLLSPSLNKVAAMLSDPYATFDRSRFIDIMAILQQEPRPSVFSLEKSWNLTSSRLVKLNPDLLRKEVKEFPEWSTMRRMILTTIHGYYLQALARLPKDKLRSEYHHSLLQAGHCYGPLDPVSNIIVNTICYSRAYPLQNVEIEAISTRGLLRIAVQSFYGLVSFLCTRCAGPERENGMQPDEAMQRLHAAGADLRIADPNLLDDDKNHDKMVTASLELAYVAAAAAALHPKPRLQIELLRPSNTVLGMASVYLQDGGELSYEGGVKTLSEALFYSLPINYEERQQQPKTNIKEVLRRC